MCHSLTTWMSWRCMAQWRCRTPAHRSRSTCLRYGRVRYQEFPEDAVFKRRELAFVMKSWQLVTHRMNRSRASHRYVAESGHPSFRPSAVVPSTEKDVTCICQMTCAFLIDLYDAPSIRLKPKLASFSKLNPRPSNCCRKQTTLVHVLAC